MKKDKIEGKSICLICNSIIENVPYSWERHLEEIHKIDWRKEKENDLFDWSNKYFRFIESTDFILWNLTIKEFSERLIEYLQECDTDMREALYGVDKIAKEMEK